jgi:hypothetical protein
MSSHKIAASAVVGAAIVGSAWLIYSKVRGYKSDMVAYADALSKVNPIEADRWSKAFAYQSAANSLRNNWWYSNQRTLFFKTEDIWHSVAITDPPPPFSQFWSGLSPQRLTNLDELARAAGHTLSEARQQILTGDISMAGPSPFPVEPSRLWASFVATVQVSGVALIGGGIVTAIHFDERERRY